MIGYFTNYKQDLLFFAGLLVFFSVMAYFVVPWLASWESQIIAFITLAVLSSVMTIYVLGWKWGFGVVVGLALVYMVHDVVYPPLLVTSEGILPSLPNTASLSSDVFIWNLLPESWTGWSKYFLTFVLIPSVVLLAASKFFGRQKVKELMV